MFDVYSCLQLEYYKQEKVNDFVQILETAWTEANLEYSNHEKDQVTSLNNI